MEVGRPRQRDWYIWKYRGGFPGGLVVKNLPARAGPVEHGSSPWSGAIPHAAGPLRATAAGVRTPEPVSVTTRSRGAHPERCPCLLPQRRPASSSEGPAQPRVMIKNEDFQRHDSTRHTQGTRSWFRELGNQLEIQESCNAQDHPAQGKTVLPSALFLFWPNFQIPFTSENPVKVNWD